jgi:hypothetical protein
MNRSSHELIPCGFDIPAVPVKVYPLALFKISVLGMKPGFLMAGVSCDHECLLDRGVGSAAKFHNDWED